MQSRASVQTPGPVWPARLSRLATRWWRRLPPSRQDRLATIGPLVSVLLFLAAITSAFWYLRQEEISRELESVVRDTEITQQRVGLRLIENQEQLVRLARELISREISNAEFSQQARTLTTDRPEITHVTWLSARRGVRATSRGPYMLVKLRPGRYTVHAQYKDRDQTQTVTVPAKGTAKAAFYWKTQ